MGLQLEGQFASWVNPQVVNAAHQSSQESTSEHQKGVPRALLPHGKWAASCPQPWAATGTDAL